MDFKPRRTPSGKVFHDSVNGLEFCLGNCENLCGIDKHSCDQLLGEIELCCPIERLKRPELYSLPPVR
jgi:hypothetical protein